jgi:hypothetical protein
VFFVQFFLFNFTILLSIIFQFNFQFTGL